MELQQSPLYETYIKKLHWQVERVDGVNMFIKRFPLFGGFAKMQRFKTFPDINHLLPIFKTYRVRRLVLEASASIDESSLKNYAQSLRPYVYLVTSPYIPTKTIRIDLTKTEDELFASLSQAKRRAVRKAIKNNVVVVESDQIADLIAVKSKAAGMLGWITTIGAKQLWEAFRPNNATTLLAYHNHTLVAGIFLLFWEDVAYYWIAGGTKAGKSVAAPTLLAWEAIKRSKQRGMKLFDFVGVWDERFPRENRDWLGFTRFKEEFGGVPLYYPTHY